MTKTSKILISLGITGTILMGVSTTLPKQAEGLSVAALAPCEGFDVALKKLQSSEYVCLTEGEYSLVKSTLVQEFDAKKDYDFDINNKETLEIALIYEAEKQGFSIEGIESKQQLAQELINLLR